jgi:hypothetical protein
VTFLGLPEFDAPEVDAVTGFSSPLFTYSCILLGSATFALLFPRQGRYLGFITLLIALAGLTAALLGIQLPWPDSSSKVTFKPIDLQSIGPVFLSATLSTALVIYARERILQVLSGEMLAAAPITASSQSLPQPQPKSLLPLLD